MAEMINIAIVDDESIQVELLEKYVQNWAIDSNIRIKTEHFHSAESFDFSWSMDKKYHIVLLDVQMSGQNGVDLAKKIREEDSVVKIIFITAIIDYIQDGYDVDAINYLIKPIKEEKLHKCLDKAVSKIPKEEKIILINVDGQVYRIVQKDITYIEAFAHYIEVNTVNGKYTTKKNISSIEIELDGNAFMKCHRSYIVGLRHVRSIGNSELELDNGAIVPVSRRQYASINMGFIKYFRGDKND